MSLSLQLTKSHIHVGLHCSYLRWTVRGGEREWLQGGNQIKTGDKMTAHTLGGEVRVHWEREMKRSLIGERDSNGGFLGLAIIRYCSPPPSHLRCGRGLRLHSHVWGKEVYLRLEVSYCPGVFFWGGGGIGSKCKRERYWEGGSVRRCGGGIILLFPHSTHPLKIIFFQPRIKAWH